MVLVHEAAFVQPEDHWAEEQVRLVGFHGRRGRCLRSAVRSARLGGVGSGARAKQFGLEESHDLGAHGLPIGTHELGHLVEEEGCRRRLGSGHALEERQIGQ